MDKQYHATPRTDSVERLAAMRNTLTAISTVSRRMARNIALLEQRNAQLKGTKKHA